MSIFKDEAIPLVIYDPESSKYQINDQAIQIISSLQQPIGVVGVAGMYRTGKSYLLNRMLLNRSDGFGVGPTVNPCTKGLWMWAKPLLGQTLDGQSCSIIVIDSEGLGALDEDSSHDIRIFSLVILLSSCFIYNSVGSIDENAIQNLSLVVNLTKNIQLKTQSQQEDLDDLAHYFPQFYWIVRDFTLQLIDQNGDNISQKDYLEKALQMQNGVSDGVEQKNRIRKLLSGFFKERDCITLVRPLTKEENLQNLENLDFDKLRPEFFEQVINLRKKILNKIKIKSINGCPLSGLMYVDLIKSYVNAINNGAVPAIESAWTYICANECQKAEQEAIENYEQVLKEILHNKFPLPFEELKSYHKMAKDSAMAVIKQKAIGENVEDYVKDLQRKIKVKLNQVKNENEKESIRLVQMFITQEFSTIDRKLKMGEYKNYQEFEKDIKLFYAYFLENGPRTTTRQVTILEFLQKALTEGAQFFVRQLNQAHDVQKTLQDENVQKLEQEIKYCRSEMMKEKNELLSKIASLETEKNEVEIRDQMNKDNINELKQQKDKIERDLKNEMMNEKNKLQKTISEMNHKLMTSEESSKDLERNKLFGHSEFEKEKALLQQKIEFYEKNAEEYAKKEKNLLGEQKQIKQENNQQLKELQNKFDATTRQLQQKINELQDRLGEYEMESNQKEQQLESIYKQSDQRVKELQKVNIELSEEIQNLQRENKNLKRNEELLNSQLSNGLNETVEELQKQIQEQEDQLKQKEDQFKQFKSNSFKDKALTQQKVEFMELQLQEYRQQIEENKRSHEAILKAFESGNDNSSRFDNAKLHEIKDQHKIECKQLESQYQESKRKLQSQIEQLTERNNELELKVQCETSDLVKEIEQLKDDLANSEEKRNKLNEQIKLLDSDKIKSMKENDQRYQKRIKELEQLVENADNQRNKEVQQAQQKAEESLTQVKNFYEIERERLEKRICEEKENNYKKFGQLQEEQYQKLKDTEQQYEEEIEQLKEELRETETQSSQMIQQYDHELALKTQTIETLEKYLKETKESLISLQNNNNSNLEQQMSQFYSERKGLVSKIENISNQLNNLQKENMGLQQKKEMLENEKQRKEQQFDQQKKDWGEERQQLMNRLDDQKQKLQNLNDEFLEKKIEYGRESALTNQQNEFLNKKIEDLQKQLDNSTQRYEEKLKIQKIEYVQELQDKLERAQDEKQQLQQKFDKIKKQSKENDMNYNKQLSQIEKEKAIIQEKYTHLEQKKIELENKLKEENQNLNSSNMLLKDQLLQEKKQLQNELDKLKQINLDLEQEKNEILTCYERDRALWEGKFQFLEQQKEQAKQDLVDALKKFEMTLMHLQQARNNEKNEQESNLNELIVSVEKKYQNQIEEATLTHQRIVSDYEDKIRKIQKELKQYKDKVLIDQHGKIGNQLLSEKKFADMLENEKRLQQEVESAKYDRDHKIQEYQKMIDQEREQFRNKIHDLENKYKEIENKRSCLIFEFEKERAKWNLDKDHLMNMKNDLQEQVEKIEKKKEYLLRENEKLKNEQRAQRRSVNPNLTNNTMIAGKQRNMNMNNVSGFGYSKQQSSPTHSNNTSTSSAVSNLQKRNALNQQNPQNLNDITNFSALQPNGTVIYKLINYGLVIFKQTTE